MNRRRIVTSLIIFCCAAMLTFAGSGQEPTLPPLDPVEQELLRTVQTQGSVRVIVGLQVGGYQLEGTLSGGQAVQSQRQMINTAQGALLNRLGGTQAQVLTRLNSVPYIALRVDEAALRRLFTDPQVTSLERDEILRFNLAESTNIIGMPSVWASGYEGTGEAVVVIDTGVQTDHPFFGGRVVAEACFSAEDASQNIASTCPNGQTSAIGPGTGDACAVNFCFHGSHVAGIATGNGPDFDGVARDAGLIAINVASAVNDFNVCGFSTPCAVPLQVNTLAAMDHAVTLAGSHNIAAVNLSLGTVIPFGVDCVAFSPSMEALVDQLYSLDVATVAGSGNGDAFGSGYTEAISHPACLPKVIAVGATNDNDNVATFSNSSPQLDLLAPGVAIESSVPPDDYDSVQGTSMAAPHVSGIYAVLREAYPNASIEDILTALQTTGLPVTDGRNGVVRPRVQVDAALAALGNGVPPRYPVVINEVQMAGTQAVELHNTGSDPAVLTDWRLQLYGASLEQDFAFPAGTTIPANGYLVAVRGSGSNTATTVYLGDYATTWNGDGSGAARLTNGGVSIDFMRWGSATVAPLTGTSWVGINPLAAGSGGSLGRDAASTDTDTGSDWLLMAPTLGAQNTPAPPANDDFGNATVIDVLPFNTQTNTRTATKPSSEPTPTCSPQIGGTVWYRYSATESQVLQLETVGSAFDTAMAVYTGNLTEIACNDDIDPGVVNRSRVVLPVDPGVTYHIMVGGYDGASGALVLSADVATDNDTFEAATVIEALPYNSNIDTTDSTSINDPMPSCFPAQIQNSVWYRYTPATAQHVSFSTAGSNFDTVLSIWTGSDKENLTEVGCHDDVNPSFTSLDLTSLIELNLTANTTYHVMLSGGQLLGSAGNLNFTVTEVNTDTPVAADDAYTTDTNTALAVDAAQGVLVNDTANGDSLTVASNTDPANGTLTLDADGGFTYTPDAGYKGVDTFTYVATNNDAQSNTATVTITVNNAVPVAADDAYTTDTDTTLTVGAGQGVLSNDTDANTADTLTAVLQSDVTRGTLALSADGSFTYTPDGTTSGTDSFTYVVNDGEADSNPATVTITLTTPGNSAPVAADDGYTVTLGATLNVTAPGVLTNDSDTDADPLTAVLQTDVTRGTLALSADGSFTYTPDGSASGTDSFTYVANDGEIDSNPATVTIAIDDPAGTPPRLYPSEGEMLVSAVDYDTNFRFRHMDGVEWYGLWIGPDDQDATVLYEWYPATDASTSAAPGTGICDVTTMICTLPDDAWVIRNDTYEWWMTHWTPGETGNDVDNNWNMTTFVVDMPAPVTTSDPRTAPIGTVSAPDALVWQRDPGVMWYQVWMGDAVAPTTVVFSWYDASTICDETTCSLPITSSLDAGDYQWWMQAWGPGGFATWVDFSGYDFTVE